MEDIPIQPMPHNTLPTVAEALGHLIHLYNDYRRPGLPMSKFVMPTIQKLKPLWTKVNIPIRKQKSILNALRYRLKKYKKISKRKRTQAGLEEAGFFELFDIAMCPHIRNNERCNCDDDMQVPDDMIRFYVDQLHDRKLKNDSFLSCF